MRTAWCPKSKDHKEFYTGAAVMETWRVDSEGHWIESVDQGDVLFAPSTDNVWECVNCGEEAVFDEPSYKDAQEKGKSNG